MCSYLRPWCLLLSSQTVQNQSGSCEKDQVNAVGLMHPALPYSLMPSQQVGSGHSRLLVGCLAVYPSPPETIVYALELHDEAFTIAKWRCQHPFSQGRSHLSEPLHDDAHRMSVIDGGCDCTRTGGVWTIRQGPPADVPRCRHKPFWTHTACLGRQNRHLYIRRRSQGELNVLVYAACHPLLTEPHGREQADTDVVCMTPACQCDARHSCAHGSSVPQSQKLPT